MTPETRGYLIAIIVLLVVAALFFKMYQNGKDRLKKAQELKILYKDALSRKDKVKALELGREYYQTLRSTQRLTIYDEQAITNDLNSIS